MFDISFTLFSKKIILHTCTCMSNYKFLKNLNLFFYMRNIYELKTCTYVFVVCIEYILNIRYTSKDKYSLHVNIKKICELYINYK